MLLSQMITTTATAGIIVALITAAATVGKKFIGRKPPPKPEYITRTEFHDGLDKVRDRITAKLDLNNRDVLAAVDRLATTTERRLDTLDSAVARLDERTKVSSSFS